MTNQQILTKSIQKSIDGGWKGDLLGIVVHSQGDGLVRLENPSTDEEWSVEEIIFNHKFAKALWGGITKCRCPRTRKIADRNPVFWADCKCHHMSAKLDWWEWQLQQMVIADDPIQYLGENI